MDTQATAAKPNLLAGLLEEPDYCRQRKITVRTARKERQTGEASPWVRIGKKIYYLDGTTPEYQNWLKKRVQNTARGR
jgi:hypothetical protein